MAVVRRNSYLLAALVLLSAAGCTSGDVGPRDDRPPALTLEILEVDRPLNVAGLQNVDPPVAGEACSVNGAPVECEEKDVLSREPVPRVRAELVGAAAGLLVYRTVSGRLCADSVLLGGDGQPLGGPLVCLSGCERSCLRFFLEPDGTLVWGLVEESSDFVRVTVDGGSMDYAVDGPQLNEFPGLRVFLARIEEDSDVPDRIEIHDGSSVSVAFPPD